MQTQQKKVPKQRLDIEGAGKAGRFTAKDDQLVQSLCQSAASLQSSGFFATLIAACPSSSKDSISTFWGSAAGGSGGPGLLYR
mmetsp:Transcript_32024/g.73454  ORF Transcript_32024/g.73454 Transcript_32024/m.73454 type:complete len:83 (-) Transcript_32024:955-1203(-)